MNLEDFFYLYLLLTNKQFVIMSSKVKIVTSTGERSRVTSGGKITFDAQGVSIEEVDREIAESLVSVSSSLSIQGEQKVVLKKEVIGEEKPKLDADPNKPKTYSEVELQDKIRDNAARLVKNIALSIGLEEAVVYEKLQDPQVAQPSVIILQTEYDELKSYVKGEVIESEGEPASGAKIEEENKELPNSPGPIPVILAPEVEEKIKELEATLEKENLDQLRIHLKDAEIPVSEWEGLKGKESRPVMIKLIIDKVRKQEELNGTTEIPNSK